MAEQRPMPGAAAVPEVDATDGTGFSGAWQPRAEVDLEPTETRLLARLGRDERGHDPLIR